MSPPHVNVFRSHSEDLYSTSNRNVTNRDTKKVESSEKEFSCGNSMYPFIYT